MLCEVLLEFNNSQVSISKSPTPPSPFGQNCKEYLRRVFAQNICKIRKWF